MKIKVEVEIDTDNDDDLKTIEEMIELLKELAERMRWHRRTYVRYVNKNTIRYVPGDPVSYKELHKKKIKTNLSSKFKLDN